MKPRYVIASTLCLLTGCLFGGQDAPEDPVVINNDAPNNTNGEQNNGLAVSSATIDEVDCSPNPVTFIVPSVDGENALQPTSGVAFSARTAVVGLNPPVAIFPNSMAWASVSGSELRMSVGGFVQNDARPERYYHATTSIEPGAEIYSLEIEPKVIDDVVPGAVVWEVTAGTSDGVKECAFRLPDAAGLDLVSDCSNDFIQSILTEEEVFAAETFDFVPLLEPNGDTYRVNLVAPSALISASGLGPRGDNFLGLVHLNINSFDLTRIGTSAAIESSLPAPEIFAARMAWGVGRKEGGWPALQVLARNPDGEDYGPRVLLRGENGYVADDTLGEWRLPADLMPTRTNFTFLDGYDAVSSSWEDEATFSGGIDVDPDQSTVKHGYAALSAEGPVVFARPGGLLNGAIDLIEADVGGGVELTALRNIPVDGAQEAFPVLVVVNEARDEFAIMQWDFGETVELLSAASGGEFEGIRSLTTPTLLDSSNAVLAFLASQGGDLGIGLFEFQDDASAAPTFRASVCSDI